MVAILFISFLVCLSIGVPVAFSLAISSLLYFIGSGMPLTIYTQRFFSGLDSFTLLWICTGRKLNEFWWNNRTIN